MNTKVIISAEDQTGGAFSSVNGNIIRLGATVGAFAAVAQTAIGAMGEMTRQTIGLYKEQISIADSLDEMSVRMGMSIKDLVAWKAAAEMNGASMEAMASGTRMLAKHMTEHGTALKKAGITSRDANEAFLQLADLFKGMSDPVQRLDLATRIFGRGMGQQLLPVLVQGREGLESIRETTDGYGEALTRLAPEAQMLNDTMYLMGINFKQAAAEGVFPLVKAFNDQLLPGIREVAKEGSLLKTMFVGFGGAMKIGFADPWTQTLLGAKATLQQFMADVSGALATVTFGKVAELHRREQQRMLEAAKVTLREAAANSNQGHQGQGGAASSNTDAAADGLQKGLRGDRAKAVKAIRDEYTPLIKSIRERTLALGAEVDAEEKLTAAQKLALKIMGDIQGGTLKLTATQKTQLAQDLESMLAKDALAVAHAKWLKQIEAEDKARSEAFKATIAETVALEKKVAESTLEVEEIGLTTEQLGYLKLARMDATIAAKEQELAGARLNSTSAAEIELIEEQVAALRQLRSLEGSRQVRTAIADEAKRVTEMWKNVADDVNRALSDAVMAGGKSGLEHLQNYAKTFAIRVGVEWAMSPIAAAVKGMGSSGGGGINLPMGGGSGLYDAFAMSGAGQSLGLSVPYIDALGGTMGLAEGGVMTGLGSGIGAALPWVGGAMALASMTGMFDGPGAAQRTGRYSSPFAFSDGAGDPTQGNNADGSRYNYLNNEWFSADMQASQDAFDARLQAQELAIAGKLGLQASDWAAINAQLSALDGKRYGFGMEHTDVAASGVFDQIEADRLQAIATGLGMSLKDLQDTMSGAKKSAYELALETQKLTAEQSKLAAGAALASIGDTLKALDSVTGLRSGLLASIAGIKGGNTYASRMGGLQDLLAGETDVSRQIDLAGQIKDLVLDRYQAERDAIGQNQAAAQQAAEALRQGLRAVGDYAKSLLLGNLSPLTNKQRLDEAGSQYQSLLGRAQGGDVSAIGGLSGAAGTYLEQARSYYASSSDYTNIFGGIQSTLSAMGLSADSVMDTTDWQAQMLAVDNEALGSLGNLTRFTEDWTLNLENLLIDQTRQFESLGVKLGDVAANTKDLDKRIAVLLDAQLGARFDKLSSAVDKSAQTTARAVTQFAQVALTRG